jgi:ubiquinone/menaquinone biosynthesis C-methylase UbiE
MQNSISDKGLLHQRAQRALFDKHYNKFDSYKLENWRKSFLNRIFSHLDIPDRSGGGYYLDVGVGGSGYTVIEAAKLGQKSIGVDLSLEAIQKARLFARQEGVGDSSYFVVCSAERLSFKDNIISKMSFASVLEHIYDDEKTIKEVWRILKEKGRVFVIVPNAYRRIYFFLCPPYYIIDKMIGHLRHYSQEALVAKFKACGFEPLAVIYSGHLIKIAQFLISKIFGEKGFFSRLWWYFENIDLKKESKNTGLQLTCVFQKG